MSDERPRPGLSTRAVRAAPRLGGVHTMVVHPPTSSRRGLDSAALAAAGITGGLLRISVGLEDEADLLADVAQALNAANAASA